MANCAGTQSSQGTGQAQTANGARWKAFGHFMLNGQLACAGKHCESGSCMFGVTAGQVQSLEWSDPMQVGNDVRIHVSGDGVCFCQ